METLYELRKTKGMTLDAARELMTDISYYGTMMVYKGDADAMVSGAAHTTHAKKNNRQIAHDSLFVTT